MLKAEFCPKCNADRPVVKAYRFPRARFKSRLCGVCGEPFMTTNKFKNKPTIAASSGKRRHSKKEARREDVLATMAQDGTIADFRRCNDAPQEKYKLEVYGTQAVKRLLDAIDNFDNTTPFAVRMAARDVRRALMKIAAYVPDFSYTEPKTGRRVVEDVKGYKTPEYKLKWRLMQACHEIEVKET